MENGFEAGCNCSETMITISAEEYKQLVYEFARNDIVRHLLMAHPASYMDTDAIRIALGIESHHKENTDE